MTTEEQTKIIEQIKDDVAYYTRIDFPILASKFTRDLNLIKELLQQVDEVNNIDKEDTNNG